MPCSFRRPRTALLTFGALAAAALAGCGGDEANRAPSNGATEVAKGAEADTGGGTRDEVPGPRRPPAGFPAPNFDPAGPVDTTFGEGGLVLFQNVADFDHETFSSIAVGEGGAIYAGGFTQHGAVARFLADGALDPSFGDGGIVRAPDDGRPEVDENGKEIEGPGDFVTRTVGLQPDGKIVVMGSYNDYEANQAVIALMRLNPDGSYDASYGAGGLATVRPPGGSSVLPIDASAGADGSIMVAGIGLIDTDGFDTSATALLRVSPEGALDGRFGGAGVATYDLPSPEGSQSSEHANAVRVMPDGSAYVCGWGSRVSWTATVAGEDMHDALLMHYLPDGQLDPGFGQAGVVYADPNLGLGPDGERLAKENLCISLDTDSRGRVVFAAVNDFGRPFEIMVMRRLPDGSPDPSFGQGGATLLDVEVFDEFHDVVVLPDDSVVAVGSAHAGDGDLSPQEGLVVHLLADGTPDPAFGEGGVLRLTYARQFSFKTVALQPDGKIVIGGTVDDGNLWVPFMLRLKAL